MNVRAFVVLFVIILLVNFLQSWFGHYKTRVNEAVKSNAPVVDVRVRAALVIALNMIENGLKLVNFLLAAEKVKLIVHIFGVNFYEILTFFSAIKEPGNPGMII